MAIRFDDLDCQKCGEAIKKIRGCEEEVEPYQDGGMELTRCPLKLITPQTILYKRVYASMKNLGALFNCGGLAGQSAKLVEVYNVIESEIIRMNRPRRKK